MKIDLSKTFIDLDKKVIGEVIQYIAGEKTDTGYSPIMENGEPLIATVKGKPLTLKRICEQALLIDTPGEKISADEKIKRSKLGMNILLSDGKEFEFENIDEIVFVQNIIKNKVDTLICGQAVAFLEPKNK